VAIGFAICISVAVPLAFVLRSTFDGLSPVDPAVLIAVTGLLLVVTLIACVLPARRAARVSPAVALRDDA
jgi:putative ABC transport system permease protein